ncbi:MAG: DUF2809 domain-containing protein [Patulibacter minatonensis]
MTVVPRRRPFLIAVGVLLVVAGLAVRFGIPGALGDRLGGIAYTALVYVVVAFAAPRMARLRVGSIALAWSVAVEVLQLTSLPADLAAAFGPSRLVFGTSFAWPDLVAALVGAAAATLVDRHR